MGFEVFLKADKVGELLTLRGSEFQVEGPAKAKARWPKFDVVRGKCKVMLWDERRFGRDIVDRGLHKLTR